MLLKFRSPFKLVQEYYQNDKNNECSKTNSLISSNYKQNLVVGLRIIVQKPIKEESNKIVVKSAAAATTALRFRQQVLKTKNKEYNSCFLKNCNLCNKRLSLDKDVYMYRGDEGFCSIECRNRQIVLDEIRELEVSTKQILASHCRISYRNCMYDENRSKHRPIINSARQLIKPAILELSLHY